MASKKIKDIVEAQRQFHATGATLDYGFRKRQLKILYDLIAANEKDFLDALKADLGKSEFEAYTSEILITLQEIKFAMRRLRRWMLPKRAGTPLVYFPSSGAVVSEPYGVSLIIAPWNYPFVLLATPLIGAIASGCCAVLKPSEVSPNTSKLFAKLINETFPAEYVVAVEGGVPETQALLAEKFDMIFYTGNTQVGKIVMKAAAENLAPVVLELGGKNPCFVTKDADLKVAARRIVWGKFFNAGQTCVAPDYLLVDHSIAKKFTETLVREIELRFGKDASKSADYCRIVNERHAERLKSLLKGAKVVHGGVVDVKKKYISPTLIGGVDLDSPVMAGEIFGPLLPIVGYKTLEEAVDIALAHPKPLALYVFTRDKKLANAVMARIPSGGACVNDCIVHISSPHLPFGGSGDSGMGAYHGKATFDAFTHFKSVMRKPFALDNPMRYAPYMKLSKFIKWALGKVM